MIDKLKKLLGIKPKSSFKILSRSNVIQYDRMGYPLRLCIVKEGKKIEQMWLDIPVAEYKDNDCVIKWEDEY